MENDTITALCTPPGKGGIGIIRISGPDALTILRDLFQPLPHRLQARHLYHGRFMSGQEAWDEGLACWFPAPRSYTGEEVCELSLHSNPHLLEAALDRIIAAGARPALPGEFTYRAFRNGKLDLLQAEAVNELITANSSVFAHIKFSNLQGRLSRTVEQIKKGLTDLAVALETAIEFQEDHLLESISLPEMIVPLVENLQAILENQRFHDALNRTPRMAITGQVNAGKSTLFNALLQEDRAIVSHIPGTTRDFISGTLHVDDHHIDLIDTAGFHSIPGDGIETEAIDRSRHQLEESDAVIWVIDGSQPIDCEDERIIEEIGAKATIVVLNKIDQASPGLLHEHRERFPAVGVLEVSALHSLHLDRIRGQIREWIGRLRPKPDTVALNLRQRSLFAAILKRLQTIADWHRGGQMPAELAAEEIRLAVAEVGLLTGEIAPEDILTDIFGKFCIGK